MILKLIRMLAIWTKLESSLVTLLLSAMHHYFSITVKEKTDLYASPTEDHAHSLITFKLLPMPLSSLDDYNYRIVSDFCTDKISKCIYISALDAWIIIKNLLDFTRIQPS